MKIRLHPLFFIFVLVITLIGGGFELLATLFAVILHELAHARVAQSRNYIIKDISLMPYGAVLNVSNISNADSFAVLSAGIVANIIFVITTIALWWLVPAVYAYTYNFVKSNLIIALINLVPCDPLDGGKLMMRYIKNPKTAKAISIISGTLTFATLISLFIYSIFVKINLSYLIFALFLLGYMFFPKIKHYDFFNKSKEIVEINEVIVEESMPLYKLIKKAEKHNYKKFRVVDKAAKTIGYIEENMLLSLAATHKATATLDEIIKSIT